MAVNRNSRQYGRHRQSGNIVIMSAIMISVIVTMLSVIDIGFLFFYKREYQKAADMAALAGARNLVGASGLPECASSATPSAQISVNQNLAGRPYQQLTVICGKWTASAGTPDTRFDASVAVNDQNAVRVSVAGAPPRFLPFMPETQLVAQATALSDRPLAQLRIRNRLVALNTANSALLNSLVGGLLGSSIDLSVAAWQGLLDANVTLLQLFDTLPAVAGLNLSAGDYDQLLGTDVSLADVLEAAAVVGGQDATVSAALNQFLSITALQDVQMSLGELLGVQLANPQEALGAQVNLFDLVQAVVQIANNEHAVAATLPIPILGANAMVTVIEKPQFSAIGNPAIDDIEVKTAQVRAYISIDLASVFNVIRPLLDGIIGGLSSITQLLNSVLSLNPVTIVNGVITSLRTAACGGLLGACPPMSTLDVRLLGDVTPSNPLRLAVDVGKATARVTGYDCDGDGSVEKSLDVDATSAIAGLSLGHIDDPFKPFPTVTPAKIMEIGELTARPTGCLLFICSDLQYKKGTSWVSDKAVADFAVKLGVRIGITDAPVLGGQVQSQLFQSPADAELPEISGVQNQSEEQIYKTVTTGNLVSSLNSTLANLDLNIYSSNSSGGLLELTASLLEQVVNVISNAILVPLISLLSSILDPLLNQLLSSLGIDLANAEDAANLSCETGATLVD